MEQELPSGLRKGQIAKFIEDQEVETGDQFSGSALALSTGFSIQLVDQIDDIEESPAPAIADTGTRNGYGKMGFAGTGAADQHEVALMVQEVTGGQITDQGLIDLCCLEGKLFQERT